MLTYAYVMISSYLATLKREEGQGMAEYGLILALIAVAVIVVMGLLGDEIANVFTRVTGDLQDAVTP